MKKAIAAAMILLNLSFRFSWLQHVVVATRSSMCLSLSETRKYADASKGYQKEWFYFLDLMDLPENLCEALTRMQREAEVVIIKQFMIPAGLLGKPSNLQCISEKRWYKTYQFKGRGVR